MPYPPPAESRWERLEALFHLLSDLPAADRDQRARVLCGDDIDLLTDLLQMLAADSSVQELLEAAPAISPDAFSSTNTLADAPDPWLYQDVGAFRLESLLGRGGMGVVYLGQRIAGGFSQTVAVKLIARHLTSGPAIEQFALERDALARLEHHNIARLIDAGVHRDGTPFVVMEYVLGRRLDDACSDPSVSLETKLGYMIQLCDVVAYVHRNLILHRDLKPGNVMVTDDGAVKLLDFGTLKLLGPAAFPDSAMTQAGMRPMTLRYASPEQIEGKPLSTATDVYSLGMILYRILAGRLPAADESLSIPRFLDQLRNAKPPSPSRSIASHNPSADAQLLVDLNAIVAKAIRFDADQRYGSASALGDDLSLALAKRPVSARAGSTRYRLRQFVRRNGLQVTTAIIACIVIALGLGAMAHEASVARAESHRAETGIEQERTLAHLLLFDYFDQLKRIPASTDAQRRAVTEALHYLDSLNTGNVSPDLALDSIHAYTEMGALQGSSYEENLGDPPGAIVTLQKAIALSRRLSANDPNNLELLRSYGAAERALGQVYLGMGDVKNAVPHLTVATVTIQKAITMPGATSAMANQAASAADVLGDAYGLPGAGTLNDPAKAAEQYRKAVLIYRTGLRMDPACQRCRSGVAIEDWKLGMAADDNTQAIAFFRDGLASAATLSPSEQATPHVQRMQSLIRQNLGVSLVDMGHSAEGLVEFQTAHQRLQDARAADPLDFRARSDLALFDSTFANSLDDIGQYALETSINEEFLENVDAFVKKDPTKDIWQFRRGMALARAGRLERRAHQTSESDRLYREALAILVPLAQKPSAGVRILQLTSDTLTASRLKPTQDDSLAITFAQRAIQQMPHPTAEHLLTLAEAQQSAGLHAESEATAQEGLKILVVHHDSISEAARQARLTALLQ
jgi:serine/threonine protein kinase